MSVSPTRLNFSRKVTEFYSAFISPVHGKKLIKQSELSKCLLNVYSLHITTLKSTFKINY